MDATKRVTVIISFEIQPGGRALWWDSWCRVREAAKAEAACRSFRLLCDTHDDTQCVVVSEWDTVAAFDAFARDVGLIWVGRSMEQACGQPQYGFFQEIPYRILETVPVDSQNIAQVQ